MSECADIEAVLTEREKTHGRYETQAKITEELKDVINGWIALRHPREQAELTSGQLQALDMIAVKIGRIIAGDPSFADHWNDIAGYAMLGARGSNPKEAAAMAATVAKSMIVTEAEKLRQGEEPPMRACGAPHIGPCSHEGY